MSLCGRIFNIAHRGVLPHLRSSISTPARCACFNYIQHYNYSAKAPAKSIVKQIDPVTGEVQKKRVNTDLKVTLLSGDSVTVTSLEEAQKLSKRRDLKLVKIIDLDTKTQRPVYKLMTGAEYHAEDLKQREKKKKDKENSYIKGEKVLLLNANISEHDLGTQISKSLKWINKMFEVRVVVSSPNSNLDKSEAIYCAFESKFKENGNGARFVQKRTKGNDVKFQILPPKKKDDPGNDL